MAGKEKSGTMNRKQISISLFVALLVVGGSAVYWLSLTTEKNGIVTTGELSDRAQEFVATQRSDVGTDWQAKQLEPIEALAVQPPSTLQETPCFSINLPLKIRTVYRREPEECALQIRLMSPAAKLTISTKPLTTPLLEDAGVSMREIVTEIYTVEDFTTSFFSPSRTYSDPQGISFFAEKDGQLLAVIFSETNDQEKILAQSLPKVLEVLMVY